MGSLFADVNKMKKVILLQGRSGELSDSGMDARENQMIECGKKLLKQEYFRSVITSLILLESTTKL